uniref:Cation-transporting P-type ATPase C-terminal domain-containing protein n=1 Tax=Plectus sambesii TaxID=2011161 RepID=A0A914XAB1_9BILA
MYCNLPYGKLPAKTLGVYKRQPGEPPVPGLTKHRTPLANFFASLSTDPKSFHYHLMAQGTADLMLDVCSHVWTGQSLREMSRSARRKVADFYQRNSMTSYCLAFSYRATGAELAPEMINKYVEWPLDRRAGAALHQVDARRPISMSVDSLLSDEFVHVDKVENAADCLDAALSDHTFLGMITLQYQAKPEVVRLVENLDKACIRFVYFSKENELRSRIFAEKIGLEAGWNCHISLANEGGADNLRKKDSGHSRKDTSSSSKYSTSLQNRADAFSVGPLSSLTGERVAAPVGVHHRRSLPRHALVDLPTVRFDCIPSSAPVSPAHSDIEMGLTVDVDDSDETSPPSVPAGVDTSNDSSLFDFATGYNRHRLSVPAMSPNLGNMLRRADEARDRPADGTKAPLLSESASAASITSSDRDIGVVPGPMPNYARLPTGIDNIRPHLEQVDNVPLLVSLFTDCDHTTNKEMIHIMQDYGEVVLAVGSSLDYYNGDTFCQANVAFAVEPSHPSTCVRKPITPPSPSKSAGAIAGQLMALPCSLWVSGGRELNLLGLIAICRHRVAMTRSGLIFLLMACAAISCAHLFSVLAFLPPLLEPVQILIWLCVSLPLLSASLLGAPFNQGESLRLTTPKNHNHVGRKVTIRTALGFAVKFLPTVFAVVLLFGFTLIEFCAKIDGADCLFHANENSSALAKGSWAVWGDEYAEGLLVARQLSAFAFTVYLCAISFGFVAYREQFWRKNPLRNVAWVGACILIVAFQIIYAAVDLYFNTHTKEFLFRLSDVNWWLFIAAALWLPIVCTLNELYKAREIQLYRRDQRRGKLSFNTKLGMNSPY